MSGWREIKAQAKAVIHGTFAVPAVYLTHVEGVSVPCSVRVHTKVTTAENEFTWPSSPGYLEIDPYIILDATEVPAPLAKSYVIVSSSEIYRIGVAEPARENFIKAQVTVLNPAECATLTAAMLEEGFVEMNRIEVNSGSDRDIKVIFPNDMRPVASPAIINADVRIADRLTASLLDAALGEVNVFLEGTDPLPLGDYVFAVQITKSDGNTEASPGVLIRVK